MGIYIGLSWGNQPILKCWNWYIRFLRWCVKLFSNSMNKYLIRMEWHNINPLKTTYCNDQPVYSLPLKQSMSTISQRSFKKLFGEPGAACHILPCQAQHAELTTFCCNCMTWIDMVGTTKDNQVVTCCDQMFIAKCEIKWSANTGQHNDMLWHEMSTKLRWI